MSHTMQSDPEAYWNDAAGPRWVECQSMLDRVMAPVTESILAVAALSPGERVVDVGCGSGSLTGDAAGIVGDSGRAHGVDISRPMIELARETVRADNVSFVLGNAQTYPFEPASFDAAISRFGVMFFRDSVAAFANIAGALGPRGRTAFAVWQPMERNRWITWQIEAIADLLPEPSEEPSAHSDAPGPFRFADPDHSRRTLIDAGFRTVEIHRIDRQLSFEASTDEILGLVTRIGPLSRALESLDADTAAAAVARVTARIQELRADPPMRLPAAWWILEAQV